MRPYGLGGGRGGIALCGGAGSLRARLEPVPSGTDEVVASVKVGGDRRGIGTCGVSARARAPPVAAGAVAPGPDLKLHQDGVDALGAALGSGGSCTKRTSRCRRRSGSGIRAMLGAGHPSLGTPSAAASARKSPQGGYCNSSTHRVCHKAAANAVCPYRAAHASSDAARASNGARWRHHRHQ